MLQLNYQWNVLEQTVASQATKCQANHERQHAFVDLFLNDGKNNRSSPRPHGYHTRDEHSIDPFFSFYINVIIKISLLIEFAKNNYTYFPILED